eukprot:9485090-Pyramimonas_sp.AAC.1
MLGCRKQAFQIVDCLRQTRVGTVFELHLETDGPVCSSAIRPRATQSIIRAGIVPGATDEYGGAVHLVDELAELLATA